MRRNDSRNFTHDSSEHTSASDPMEFINSILDERKNIVERALAKSGIDLSDVIKGADSAEESERVIREATLFNLYDASSGAPPVTIVMTLQDFSWLIEHLALLDAMGDPRAKVMSRKIREHMMNSVRAGSDESKLNALLEFVQNEIANAEDEDDEE